MPAETARPSVEITSDPTPQGTPEDLRVFPLLRTILFSILSGGIYNFYWFYITHGQIARLRGRTPAPLLPTLLLLVPIASLVVAYRLWKEIDVLAEWAGTRPLRAKRALLMFLSPLLLPLLFIPAFLLRGVLGDLVLLPLLAIGVVAISALPIIVYIQAQQRLNEALVAFNDGVFERRRNTPVALLFALLPILLQALVWIGIGATLVSFVLGLRGLTTDTQSTGGGNVPGQQEFNPEDPDATAGTNTYAEGDRVTLTAACSGPYTIEFIIPDIPDAEVTLQVDGDMENWSSTRDVDDGFGFGGSSGSIGASFSSIDDSVKTAQQALESWGSEEVVSEDGAQRYQIVEQGEGVGGNIWAVRKLPGSDAKEDVLILNPEISGTNDIFETTEFCGYQPPVSVLGLEPAIALAKDLQLTRGPQREEGEGAGGSSDTTPDEMMDNG